MLISVVIPTKNKAERLRHTLRALDRQHPTVASELIVVDDGSTDDTAALLADNETGPVSATLRLDGQGRSAARNRGARAASGDLLVFLDDDIVVAPGFLAAHLKAHTEGAATVLNGSARTGAPMLVHGPLRELPGVRRLLNADPVEVPDPHRAITAGQFGRTVPNALERLVSAMADGQAPPVAPWLVCVGANVSIPAERWRSGGGFDERFGQGWGCEDLEFGYRLVRDGAVPSLASGASGVHLSHHRPNRWHIHDEGLRRFIRYHPDDPAIIALPELLSATGGVDEYLRAVARTESRL